MSVEVTGLFGIFDPYLIDLDESMQDVPPVLRLMLWGAGAGTASMLLYWIASPQGRLRTLAEVARSVRGSLKTKMPSHKEFWWQTTLLLKLSYHRVLLSLGGLLLSAIPTLFLISFLNGSYGLTSPMPREPVAVLCGDCANVIVEGGQQFAAGWTVSWPGEGEEVRILDGTSRPILKITPRTHPGTARKSGVVATLFGAPAGALGPKSELNSLTIETKPRPILQPEFYAPYQWTVPFFLALLIASLLIKLAFRIR